jgi:Holliday junction DNA helicase RuvB
MLSSPLRGRFGLFYHLDFYSDEDLSLIVQNSANALSVAIEHDAALCIARRSRGTPRIANRLLRRVRDYVQVNKLKSIDAQAARKALEGLGIDEKGLDDLDRKVILTVIEKYKGGPAGIESIAATLNEEADTLVDAVEPYLLKSGFLQRTPRGRQATELAYEHLGISLKKEKQKELF